jgi:hypothetical protein
MRMVRRQFLKMLGFGAVAVAASFPGAALAGEAATTAASGGYLYRAGSAGRVYVSGDGGSSWALHTSFGPEFSIRRLATDRGDRVHATLGFAGRSFDLGLGTDRTSWYTA